MFIVPSFAKIIATLLFASVTLAVNLSLLRETDRLRDAPPVGTGSPQYLDGEDWLVTSADGSISTAGYVPGDLITDLQLGGIMGDPIYNQNWLEWLYANQSAPLWDSQLFTYTKTFDADANLVDGSTVQLTFDGVKMAADVVLNGVSLGFTNDMFLRTVFDVTQTLKPTNNTLTITFALYSDSRNEAGRWPACSGGWDWGFYSQTHSNGANLRTFTKGIWRSVYLVPIMPSGALFSALTPLVFSDFDYPTAPLVDGANGPWRVEVRAFFDVPGASSVAGELSVTGSWQPTSPVTTQISLPPGSSNVTSILSASNVNLWWPNGLGNQALYSITVTWIATGSVPQTATRSIGFRTGFLVTADDTDPASLKGVDGSGNFTFRWKVNGLDIWARGGNIIPIDEMEGRFAAATYERIVDSAASAGMNALRIWGGGVYPPDVFFERADQLGVLIRHDAMFAGDGRINPTGSPMEEAELRQQVRRIASFPSVFSYDACNECGGGGIFASFVNTVMAEEDPSRPQWPSNPSNGWVSGVDRLTGLPNGNPLVARKSSDSNLAPLPLEPLSLTSPRGWASTDNCTTQFNTDYAPGPVRTSVPANTSSDCCTQCAAAGASVCNFAVFFQDTCYFKLMADAAQPVWSAGRIAVWPSGAGPIPPTPAPTGNGIIEQHGPYQHGGGFPAVNGNPSDGAFNSNIPVALAGPFSAIGPHFPGIFYSEFGASAWSSFESVAPTLPPENWALHGGVPPNPKATCQAEFSGICPGKNPLAQRNYPADSFILTYFPGLVDLNETGASAFQKQLFLAVLAQGIEMKADITARRSNNHWGTVFWQLNEIFPTGGWGSIEYGTVGFTPGQVVGGRWKSLQHFCASILYRDVFISCGLFGNSASCFVRNDDPLHAVNAIATVTTTRISGTGSVLQMNTTAISLPRGAGAAQWFCLGNGDPTSCESLSSYLSRLGCSVSGSDCVIFLTLTDANTGVELASNFELLGLPAHLTLSSPSLSWVIASTPNADRSVNVTVTATTAPAAFVTLTTLAQGRFSDNVFWLNASGTSRTVSFIPFGPLDLDALTDTLRVEHLQQYL